MRALTGSFMDDLLNKDGLLNPILQRVKQDHTLMLSIRKDYINIYYRGGNILKVRERSNHSYSTFFDKNYKRPGVAAPDLPDMIKNQHEARTWVDSFQNLKGIMDFYFSERCKLEREFLQLVARENNFSSIANQTEYFVSDIEFEVRLPGARFRIDMMAVRWLASQRKSTRKFRPAFIEMKYGDSALEGNAGVLKHLKDIETLISYGDKYKDLMETMKMQFNQLDKLKLLRFNRVAGWTNIQLDPNDKPEVIFIFANHNPRRGGLNKILNGSEIETYDHSPNFDLKFFMASLAGYALNADCMLTLSQFRELLKKKNAELGAPQDGESAKLH